MTKNKDLVHLSSRSVLRVTGKDAADFLQNILTNDINLLDVGGLQYSLLLTPQGQILHDVFVSQPEKGNFCIDCDASRVEDLLRRMTMFKLRATVDISMASAKTYVDMSGDAVGMKDPRPHGIGCRIYLEDVTEYQDETAYRDACINAGLSTADAIVYGKDFSHEVNLDLLGAISWTKGCFIGQEVAARVYNKGLAKRRLVLVRSENGGLQPANAIKDEAQNEIGQIRAVTSDGKTALALCRLEFIQEAGAYATMEQKVNISLPAYIL